MTIENSYPIRLTVARPERFSRSHVFLRLAVLIAISILAAFAWLVGLIYFVVPVVAAAFISSHGVERFRSESGPRMRGWLHWIVAADAYLTFLTDRIPTDNPEDTATFEVEISGEPTTGSALLRLIKSIPSAFVLVLLGVVTIVTAFIAAVFVLIREDYPDPLYRFHLAVVRWGARLLGYHASLTDEYPPFSLDMDQGTKPRTRTSSTAANPSL